VTQENRKINIQEELARAQTALGAADLLAASGCFNEGVSRLYYSLLYEVRAMLLTEGPEPKSHEGETDPCLRVVPTRSPS
jgi:uncharacterized protein (UPF0332 family)